MRLPARTREYVRRLWDDFLKQEPLKQAGIVSGVVVAIFGAIATLFGAIVALSAFMAQHHWSLTEPTFVGRMHPPRSGAAANQSNLNDALNADLSPGAYRITAEVTALDRSGATVSVTIASFNDPHNGAQVLGAYVPRTEDTVEIVKSLIREHQGILGKLIPSKGSVTISAKGEHNPNTTDWIRFTGRVFIYHETLLSPNDYKTIDESAQAAGVYVTLRDPSYLTR
jgi:hypothetical protein